MSWQWQGIRFQEERTPLPRRDAFLSSSTIAIFSFFLYRTKEISPFVSIGSPLVHVALMIHTYTSGFSNCPLYVPSQPRDTSFTGILVRSNSSSPQRSYTRN